MTSRWGSVLVACLLLLVASCVTGADAPALDVALCQEVHGYADEYNNHFKITVTHDPSDDEEAVVLVARAFPVNVGALTQNWLTFNATYVNAKGSKTVSAADGNGILKLNSVAANSQVEVWVGRLRPDGPVPFRFFSYHSNYPSCYIPVSPTNAFVALIPRTVRENSATPARIYFQTTLPKDMNAFIVKEGGTGASTGVFVLSADKKSWELYTMEQVIVKGAGTTVLFGYQPGVSGTDPYVFLYLSVQFTNDESGGSKGGDTTSQDKGGPLPGSDGTKRASYKGLHGFLALLTYGAILLVIYLVAGSYYNYSRNGLQEFPEMIPHIDFFRSCVVGCLSFSSGLRPSQRYSGYSSVRGGGTEMDNPYNL